MLAEDPIAIRPLHALRVVASFTLLGAALAGALEVLPVVAVAAAGFVDLHVVGAVLGGLTGAFWQTVRR